MPVEVPLLGGHDPASEDGQFHVVPVAGPHDVAEPPPTRQRGALDTHRHAATEDSTAQQRDLLAAHDLEVAGHRFWQSRRKRGMLQFRHIPAERRERFRHRVQTFAQGQGTCTDSGTSRDPTLHDSTLSPSWDADLHAVHARPVDDDRRNRSRRRHHIGDPTTLAAQPDHPDPGVQLGHPHLAALTPL